MKITFFSDLFRVRYPYTSPDDQRRARTVLLLSVVMTLLLIVTIVALSLQRVSGTSSIGIGYITLLLPVAVAMFGIGWLVQIGRLKVAAFGMTLAIGITYFTAFVLDYRADSIVILLFIVPILTASLLIGVRGLVLATLFFAGVGITTLAFQISSDSFQPPIGSRQLASTIATGFYPSLILSSVLIYQFLDYIAQFVGRYDEVQKSIVGLAKISAELNEKPLISKSLQEIADLIRVELKVDHVLIYRLQGETLRLILVAATGLSGQRLVREGYRMELDNPSGPAQAYRRKAVINLNRNVSVPQREAFLPSTNTELAYPILSSDGQCIGILDLQLSSNIIPSQGEVELYQSAVHQLAVALQRENLRTDLEQLRQEMDAANVSARRYQAEVNRMSQQNVGLAWGTYLSQSGRAPAFQWDKGILKRWRPETVTLPESAQINQLEIGQRMVIPLNIGTQTIGEIIFENNSDHVEWSTQTIDFVMEVMNRLALALENIRLFDEVQRVAVREQLVSQVAAELQDARNLARLVNVTSQVFSRSLGTDQTYVRLGTPSEVQTVAEPVSSSMD
ncbi:MAG: GAF domain-containing protein [Chloroflexi bacterium]|nr:GAF domain-containing protein [Chloroflexota bacterium]